MKKKYFVIGRDRGWDWGCGDVLATCYSYEKAVEIRDRLWSESYGNYSSYIIRTN